MMRRQSRASWPIVPTLIVVAAVAVMIRLGFWQIERLHEKEALIAHAQAALKTGAEAPWPRLAGDVERVLYRHSRIDCIRVVSQTATSGQNVKGEAGWAQVANCGLAGGGVAKVVLGWSALPPKAHWQGGPVTGVVAPGPRLVAVPAQAGLAENALPDPANLPNNHLSYAVQWFLFAGVALVIYVLAVRKRLAEPGPRR
jgi:surfeit locus 1 family protein